MLHKVHIKAATFTKLIHCGHSIKLTSEHTFKDNFINMLCHVVILKKGVTQADRIVKFLGTYIHYLNLKGVCPWFSGKSS